MPMPSWKVRASAIALWLAAGWVPISSNLRTLAFMAGGAGISGHSLSIFDLRT